MTGSKNYKLLGQILLWWAAWFLVTVPLTDGFAFPDFMIRRIIVTFIGIALVVVVNEKYLLPKLYFKKKPILFIFGAMALLFFTVLLLFHEVWPWAEDISKFPVHRDGGNRRRPILLSMKWMARTLPFLIAWLGNTLIEISRYANRKEKEAIRLDKERLETELKFLKSQINPHFLFNALNNIYSLSIVQAPQTPDSVMQLSEILRYMVYDANEEKVALSNEVNYIENFVNLVLLKDSQGMDVKLNLHINHPNYMIAPLLFIPFVENAFKHSKIEDQLNGFIRINFETQENKIMLNVVNSLPKQAYTVDKVGGVGLENIKKRLHLLYPGNLHDLNIVKTEDEFRVNLKLIVR
ncbi:sensor histidine kinase [Membranihabitans marinus]|uniref:sensor histidine kinase n=1 Tax=Membranihabitans marinus TaxID=1227546 RepID=UPI001F2023AD|nr:sensor histidine kinase [Membranihabitans marinus]